MPPRDDVTLTGPPETAQAHVLRDFLTRSDQPFTWKDAPAGTATTVTIDGGSELRDPTLEELADALGVRYAPSRREYDLIIVGAGPAGIAAAVYAASDGLRTVVAERAVPGGQAAYTSRIENYFGIDPTGPEMSGARLARIGGRQAEAFGAEILILRGVVGGASRDGLLGSVLSDGTEIFAPALVCATGVEWRRLEADGVEELVGRGVHYGSGRSEAPRLRGRKVAVVGGGNSAGQAVLHFAAFADEVTMICRGEALGASLSHYLIERIEADPRIRVRLRTRVTEAHGNGRLESVTVEDAGGRTERLALDGLFVAIGGAPQTQWAEGSRIRRDEVGYLLTGPDLLDRGEPPADWPLTRPPLGLESSLPGFFVAGDVRHGSTKRVAAAVGEGANAVALVHRYLEERR